MSTKHPSSSSPNGDSCSYCHPYARTDPYCYSYRNTNSVSDSDGNSDAHAFDYSYHDSLSYPHSDSGGLCAYVWTCITISSCWSGSYGDGGKYGNESVHMGGSRIELDHQRRNGHI
jgi:hypothetical protein